jgi:ribosome-associated protein
VLDLTGISSFTDFFVICTGSSAKQNQAISDEVAIRLKKRGELPLSVEGYSQADWVLSDYGDLVVHSFTPKARGYYDLERLWREGKPVEIPPEAPVAPKRRAAAKSA